MTNGFELNNDGKPRYSKSEKILFSIFPKDGKKVDVKYLVEKRRKVHSWDIKFAENSTTCIMASLIRKLKTKNERFRIRKSNPGGPYTTQYWFENLDK
jgi:hypothetical protein